MPTTHLTFTCGWCQRTHSGPIEHPRGTDGDEVAAFAYISGRRSMDHQHGPLCPACLEAWLRDLDGAHFAHCIRAAKAREERTNKAVQVYSQHLRGKDGTAQGVWICSTGRFQEIPRTAKTTHPRKDAWKPIRGVPTDGVPS